MKGYDESSTEVLESALIAAQTIYPDFTAPLLQAIYDLGVKDGELKQLRDSIYRAKGTP